MSSCDSSSFLCSGAQRALSPSLVKLTELLEDKVNIFQKTVSAEEQGCEERDRSFGSLWRYIGQSQEFGRHLGDLQRSTEQEISQVTVQLRSVRLQQELLGCELADLEHQRTEVENSRERTGNSDARAWLLRTRQELQGCIAGKAAHAARLRFREQALSALQDMLGEDAQRYQQEALRLKKFNSKVTNGMPGTNQLDNNMDISTRSSAHRGAFTNGHAAMTTKPHSEGTRSPRVDGGASAEDAEKSWRASKTAAQAQGSSLTRSSSVKDLIHKFTPSGSPPVPSPTGSLLRVARPSRGSEPDLTEARRAGESGSASPVRNGEQSPPPSVNATPPSLQPGQSGPRGTGSPGPATPANAHSKRGASQRDGGGLPNGSASDSGTGTESHFDPDKQPETPPSEEEAANPKVSQNQRYGLFLDCVGNGSRDPDGPAGENGPRGSRWENGSSSSRFGPSHRGSLESLPSRDWDTMSDRMGGFESPTRVFNSPYTSASIDYSPSHRISQYKVQEVTSPATSEFSLFGFHSRSTSPLTVNAPRERFSAYDTLRKGRPSLKADMVIHNHSHLSMRPGMPNKRDYIEELTKQHDACQRRNQFLEAESVELDKERNQIRFEMRGLLVNNEDLLRSNTQLQVEMRKMRERMVELEMDNSARSERFRQMEIELKEAREVMVEASTQEYAFNFLQQSLKNKIQDAEEVLEKQTQHAQGVSEKLWMTERKLEQLESEHESRGKKNLELNSTVLSLETELAEALQVANQVGAEQSLQQKLRADAQLRVEELEESLLEKDQELLRVQQIAGRLQGEVSGKLMDKDRTLEEETQLRERVQLQCKQAERTVEDLQMERQTLIQSKEELVKQLKQAQEKTMDLESDLEEMHDSEERWASKHKRAIEQTEQLQLKLIQKKDLTDQLDCEKVILERQIRDLRVEVEELQNSRVQGDVIIKAESKAKELENALKVEERSKVVLANTVSKLERKINELSDQMEEDHKLATEQKDLMTQRIRSLKRQLNEAEEGASRKEAQHRHTQRELAEEREASTLIQRQLLDQHLQMKRKESIMMRQTLDSLRLDLCVDEEDEKTTETTSSRL